MDFTKIKKLTIGGVELKQLLVGGIQVWKSGYKNWVKYSTEADDVTIYGEDYNGDGTKDGYKDGYRIRSGGAEATLRGGRITGFIPVVAGNAVRFYGWNREYISTGNAVNFYDASHTNIGQFTSQPYGYGICSGNIPTVTKTNEVYQFTVPNNANIRYMRVSATHGYDVLPPEMVVTVNEEIA